MNIIVRDTNGNTLSRQFADELDEYASRVDIVTDAHVTASAIVITVALDEEEA